MQKPSVCLIGDIVIDVTLKTTYQGIKLRMGGIIHAARCLWAMNIPFSVGYFAPAYLDIQISNYLNSIDCHNILKLGNIEGAPYIFLIEEVKEIANQNYEFLLRDEVKVLNDVTAWEKIVHEKYSDYLLISGNYDLISLINNISGNIHVDLANNVENFAALLNLQHKVETIFTSTSSNIFKENYNNDFSEFSNLFERFCKKLILKENRGGSRGLDLITKEIVSMPSQTQPIVHSVGVGDVYDATFVSQYHKKTFQDAMALSSWIAAEYAVTTYPDDFKKGVDRILSSNLNELKSLDGIFLPWEARKKINIYIAAPDFDFIDSTHIDKIVNSLHYHNFSPRRPIKENGQMEKDATKARRQKLFASDIALLHECDMLVAVLINNDPGTLLEIGFAAARGLPTIVYDPYNLAKNCMLTEMPTLVSHDLDKIIAEVFSSGANLKIND